MPKPDIEALAHALAGEELNDWVTGDRWFGFPDYDNNDQWEEAIQRMSPSARENAERYLKIAGVL